MSLPIIPAKRPAMGGASRPECWARRLAESFPHSGARAESFPQPVTGIFESEISLPVHVHYAVDEQGLLELTHVVLTSDAERLFAPKPALLWPNLSRHDFKALQFEAEADARHPTNPDLHNPL